MKYITVAVPDDIYQRARLCAAGMGRSVSSLLAEFLTELSDRDAEFVRREDLQHKVRAEITQFSAGDRLHRDAIHDRAVR